MIQEPKLGIITLDPNGKVCFVVGGFPGSKTANEGSVLPIEKKEENNKNHID